MNEVSPFGFIFFPGAIYSDLPLDIFKGLLELPVVLLDPVRRLFPDLLLFGDIALCLGPLSFFWRIYLIAYSLE
jgi:hypothetical protein